MLTQLLNTTRQVCEIVCLFVCVSESFSTLEICLCVWEHGTALPSFQRCLGLFGSAGCAERFRCKGAGLSKLVFTFKRLCLHSLSIFFFKL